MLLLLWFLLILLGLLFRKSRGLAFLQIVFIAIMTSLNTNNPDRSQYYSLFTGLKSGSISIFNGNIVSNLLLKIFSFLGSYETALFAIVVLCMFLIYKAIVFHTKQVSFVLSLYLIASFTIDATQIKNFIALSIWLYFSKYLYLAYLSEGNKRTNLILYFLGCLLATGAHFSFAYMFLFVFVVVLRDRNIGIRTVVVGVIISLAVYNIDFLFGLASKSNISIFVLATRKLADYSMAFNQINMLVRMRRTVEVFIIMGVILYYCKRRCKKENGYDSVKYNRFLTVITFLSLFSLPFMKYSLEIYRIQRNLLILFYVLLAKQNAYEENKTRLSIIRLEPYTFIGIVLATIYLVLDSIFGNYETVFKTLFRL